MPDYYHARPDRCHEYAKFWAARFLETGTVHDAPHPPPAYKVPDDVALACAYHLADGAYSTVEEAALHDQLICSVLDICDVDARHLRDRMMEVTPGLHKVKGPEFKIALSREVVVERRDACVSYLRRLGQWRREHRELFRAIVAADGKTLYVYGDSGEVYAITGHAAAHPWSPPVINDPHKRLKHPLKLCFYIAVGAAGALLLRFVSGTSGFATPYRVSAEGGRLWGCVGPGGGGRWGGWGTVQIKYTHGSGLIK